MRREAVYIAILLAGLFFWPLVSAADQSSREIYTTDFFEKDAARNVWGKPAVIVGAVELNYFPPTPKPLESGQALSQATSTPGPQAEEKMESVSLPDEFQADEADVPILEGVANEEPKQDTVAEELRAKYGDPAKEAPIMAIESAPAPFKGMMAALEAKRDDLAFEYARQYVRYVHELQTRIQRTTGMVGVAAQHEGYLPQDGWASNPAYQKERALLEASLKKAKESEDSPGFRIDAKAKEMLQKAKDMEATAELAANNKKEVGQDPFQDVSREKAERRKAREQLKGKVPVDPQGKVDVYYFFRPGDKESVLMAREVQSLFNRRGKGKINFIGMALSPLTESQESLFRRQSGAAFPIQDGKSVFRLLKLKSAPSVVLVAHSTGESHVESGVRSSYYMDEVLKLMEGK